MLTLSASPALFLFACRYFYSLLCGFGFLRMSYDRLLYQALTAIVIVIGLQFEERKLVREFGRAYEEYRARTPMLFPLLALWPAGKHKPLLADEQSRPTVAAGREKAE